MAILASTVYDPSTVATASTAALLAMTAFDTTNMRLTFTAPSNGIVLVRIRVPFKGATSSSQTLLGVLDGATIRGRQAPIVTSSGVSTTTGLAQNESVFLVTGLTGGNSYTWDAAYGVEFAVASTQYGWGGPNNTTSADAYGGFIYEIWDTPGLLAGTFYDPTTAASSSTASNIAMTAFDTTNLRLNFNAPSSGRVLVRIRVMCNGTTGSNPSTMMGILEGSTVRGRACPWHCRSDQAASAATTHLIYQHEAVISGLTGGANLTWDAAYGVESLVAGTQFRWGGPDNTTQDDAYGGFAFEVWTA